MAVFLVALLCGRGAALLAAPQPRRHGPLRASTVDDATAVDGARGLLEGIKATAGFGEAWDGERALLIPSTDGASFSTFFGLAQLKDACDGGFVAEAGRGVVGLGGWQMARVGKKGSAVPWPDVRAAIANAATVVLNSADANVPALASLSVAALDAFRLPVCVNVYTTGAGAQTSAPPHTDKQRVLVLQCEGNKRWRVYPPAKLAVGTEPLARGKGEDLLAWAELAEPLIDCVLRPGDVLYIPAGFPHATETVSCYEDTAPAETDLPRASLHLTLGVDTHIWGLDGYGARGGVLRRTNRVDRLRPESDLGDDAYWRLRRTLPLLGWRASADANADTEAMATAITEAARAAETRVDGAFEDADATVVAVAKKLRAHASALVSAQRAHLSAVAQALKPLGASSAPTYFVALERLQISLDEWYGEFETREFSMGDEVQATITGDDSTFFDAYVEKEHADGTLDLVFFDGDAEYGVPKSRVRRKKVKAAKKGTSAAAKGGFGGAPKSAKAAKKKR